MKLSLFDIMIVPILLYGSKVWGICGYQEIDKLHLKFCKRMLSVKQHTPSCAVYGELGRFPLSNICIERSLKYWLYILKSPNFCMYDIYMNQIMSRNVEFVANHVKHKIELLGFGYLLEYMDVNVDLLPISKNRCRDHFYKNVSKYIICLNLAIIKVTFKKIWD